MIKNLLLLMMFSPVVSFADSTDVSIWKRPKLFLQLERFNTLVDGKGANLGGIRGGLEFGKKYRIGIGYYNLNSDIIEYIHLTPEEAVDAPADSVKGKLFMGCVPLCLEYIFYNKGKWQFSIPLHIGVGNTYFEYFNKYNETKSVRDHSIILADIIIAGQYKIVKWVGIGAGIGYSKIVVVNPSVERNLSSPMYSIGLKIFLGEIYRTVFPHGLCGKKDYSQ